MLADNSLQFFFLLLLDLLASLDLFFKKTAKKIYWIIYRNHYEIVMATFWAIFLIWLKLIFDLSRYILGDFLWNLGDISLFSSGNTAWVRSGAFQKALRRRKVGAFSFIFLFVRLEEFAHLLEHNVRSKKRNFLEIFQSNANKTYYYWTKKIYSSKIVFKT